MGSVKALDLQTLCAALGFTAVLLQEGDAIPEGERAARATALARLIEEFCRSAPPAEAAARERMTAAIVAIMRAGHECRPEDMVNKGFTAGEIERHWPMARALAQVELGIADA